MVNLSRYQPQSPLSLRDAIDRLFEESWIMPRGAQGQGGQLPANLFEGEDAFVVQVALPGVHPDNCEVTVRENILTIRGERGAPAPEGMQPVWQGLGGSFQQSFTLPWPVESNGVEATYEHGVLSLRLPKAEHAKTKRIPIKSGNVSA